MGDVELEELLKDLDDPEFQGEDLLPGEADALLAKLDNIEMVQVDDTTMTSVNTATSVKQVIKELEDPQYAIQKDLVERDILKYFDNPELPTGTETYQMLDQLDDFWYGKWYEERMDLYNEYVGLDNDVISSVTSDQMARGRADVKNMFEGLEMADLSKKDTQQQLVELAEDPNLNQKPVSELVEGDFEEKRAEVLEGDEFLGGDIELEPLEQRLVDLNVPVENLESNIKMFNIEQGSRVIASEGFETIPSYGWDLIPTAGEMGEMALGFAGGLVGGAALYGLVEGLTPIIRSLTDLNWIKHPGDTAEHLQAVAETRGLLHMYGGQYVEMNQKINNYFKDHITYVWFKDTLEARIPGAGDQYGPDIGWYYNGRQPYTTNLWLRGRILYMEGTRLGFTDSKCELSMMVKIGLGFVDNVPNHECFWVSDRTTILRDTIEVQHALNAHNLSHLIFRDITSQDPPESTDISPVGETRDDQMYRLMHPHEEETVTDVAFGTAGEGVIEERDAADDDIRHMFMSSGKVITHHPEQQPTELHVGDRVKVVSGTVKVRAGEMHGTIVGRSTNDRFRVNLDKEGVEGGVHMIYGFDLAKELADWSRYHDAKGSPLKIGDKLRHRGHTMEIGSFYKRSDEYYARDPDENMSMMLSQSYLVEPEEISGFDQHKLDQWTAVYEKPPTPPTRPVKQEIRLRPSEQTTKPRRRLLDDSKWWYERRFFWIRNGEPTVLYEPNSANIRRGENKIGKFEIPDFEGLVCVSDKSIGWEFLNIFVEEMCGLNGVHFSDRDYNVFPTYDYNGRRTDVSYHDLFYRRIENPSTPWDPNFGNEIDFQNAANYTGTKVYAWRFLFDLCGAIGDEEEHQSFINILYTIAGSRDPDSWVRPDVASINQLHNRKEELETFLDFAENKHSFIDLGNTNIDISDTRTYRKMRAEFQLLNEHLSKNVQVVEQEMIDNTKRSIDQTPIIVVGSVAVLGICMYYADA